MKLEVPKQLQRSRTKDEDGVSVLDVGCGVKFSQALLNNDLPIGSYTGVDVYEPVIAHLSSAVTDPRFRYHHANFFNARYNPGGVAMTAESTLPIGGARPST